VSALTRKLKKAKKREGQLEAAREVLGRTFNGNEYVLDYWDARQFLAFIKLGRRFPHMGRDALHFFINSIQRDPIPFGLEDISERIQVLCSSKAFTNKTYSTSEAPNRIPEHFSYWKPSELRELIDFILMDFSSKYILALMHFIRWSQDTLVHKFRFEDVEAAMNVARVRHVMET
jgi:hypothetical protein